MSVVMDGGNLANTVSQACENQASWEGVAQTEARPLRQTRQAAPFKAIGHACRRGRVYRSSLGAHGTDAQKEKAWAATEVYVTEYGRRCEGCGTDVARSRGEGGTDGRR